LVFPGGVDIHAHIQDGAETFYPGSCAAIMGGITTVIDMPPFKSVTNAAQLEQRKTLGERECVSDFGFTGGIVIDEEDLKSLHEIQAGGVNQFKIFMLSKPPVELLWSAVKKSAELGMRLVVHMEEPALLDEVNWDDPLGFPKANPPTSENVAVAQLLEMAKAAGAAIHVCHVSSARSAELIAAHKSWGTDVSAETTPHYLILNEELFLEQPDRSVVTPALRKHEDNAILWQALEEGIIDAVISDHFLGALPEAQKGRPSPEDAEPGIAGLELSFPLIYDQGVRTGKLSLKRFVETISTTPALLSGIGHRKGQIAKDMDADLVLYDPSKAWTVSALGQESRITTLPYEGWVLKSSITKTFLRGNLVWDGHKILSNKGIGRYIPAF